MRFRTSEKSDQISQHLEQLEKDFYQVRRNEVMNHYLETRAGHVPAAPVGK